MAPGRHRRGVGWVGSGCMLRPAACAAALAVAQPCRSADPPPAAPGVAAGRALRPLSAAPLAPTHRRRRCAPPAGCIAAKEAEEFLSQLEDQGGSDSAQQLNAAWVAEVRSQERRERKKAKAAEEAAAAGAAGEAAAVA